MKYREFIKHVQLNSGFSDSESEQATQVFMETLAARLPEQELHHLTSQLPPEIASMAQLPASGREKLHGNEFLERIAHRQGIDEAHAKKQMYAVWRTLKQAVSKGEIEHIHGVLPKDLAEMLY